MKLTIDHQTLSATKPLAHAVWDEPHDVSAPTHALGTLGATVTIDLANGMLQTGTLGANLTITLPSVPANTTEHLTLLLTNDATAGRSITITGIKWMHAEAPEFDTAANATNLVSLRGTAAGWIGDGGKYA